MEAMLFATRLNANLINRESYQLQVFGCGTRGGGLVWAETWGLTWNLFFATGGARIARHILNRRLHARPVRTQGRPLAARSFQCTPFCPEVSSRLLFDVCSPDWGAWPRVHPEYSPPD